jgi:hypothetical protein
VGFGAYDAGHCRTDMIVGINGEVQDRYIGWVGAVMIAAGVSCGAVLRRISPCSVPPRAHAYSQCKANKDKTTFLIGCF